MAFDPDAFLKEGSTSVAEPTAFDVDAFLKEPTPPSSRPNDVGSDPLIGGSGGVGMPLNPDLAKDVAARRVINRNNAFGIGKELGIDENGNLTFDNGPGRAARAALEGAANTASLGLSDAAPVILSRRAADLGLTEKPINLNSPLQPRTTNPLSFEVGKDIGMLLPTSIAGRIGKTALGAGKAAGQKLLARFAENALPVAGMGAVQGAASALSDEDKANVADVAKSALTSGVLSGVTGGLLAEVPGAIRGIADKLSSSPFDKLTQAVRPANKLSEKWQPETILPAMQTIKDLGANGETPQGMQGTINAARTAQSKIYSLMRSVTDDPNALMVDGKALEQKIIGAVANDKNLIEDPQAVKNVVDNFRGYFRDIPLDEAQRLIEQTNAHLQGPYYNRTIQGQSATRGDLDIASQKAFGDALRDARDQVLEEKLGEHGKDLGKMYGAIAQIKLAAQNRFLVAARQAMFNLPEQIQYGNSGADIAEAIGGVVSGNPVSLGKSLSGPVRAIMTKILRNANKSENLVTSAFDKIKPGQSPLLQYDIPATTEENPVYSAADIQEAIARNKALKAPAEAPPNEGDIINIMAKEQNRPKFNGIVKPPVPETPTVNPMAYTIVTKPNGQRVFRYSDGTEVPAPTVTLPAR